MSQGQSQVVIALGSNIGEPRDNIEAALGLLQVLFGENVLSSKAYQSEPVDMSDAQAAIFINSVAVGHTCLTPQDLLKALQGIEVKLGRSVAHGYHESRTIDLDIIAYGDLELRSESLIIPHPEAKNRLFVLLPLAELLPKLILPGERHDINQLIAVAPAMQIFSLPTPLRARVPL